MTDFYKNLRDAYRENLSKSFPYSDARKLMTLAGGNGEDFIPELDHYAGYIAGYASSPERLKNVTADERLRAQKVLKNKFFQQFPHIAKYQNHVTIEDTPELHALLHSLEECRLMLLHVLQE